MHRATEHESLRRGIDRDEDLRHKPEILEVLSRTDQGQFPEAVIRMLVLMAHARGSVRRSRLERSNAILRSHEPFAGLASETRARLISEQSLIVDLEPERRLMTEFIHLAPLEKSISWMKRQLARSAAPLSSLAPEMPRIFPTIT